MPSHLPERAAIRPQCDRPDDDRGMILIIPGWRIFASLFAVILLALLLSCPLRVSAQVSAHPSEPLIHASSHADPYSPQVPARAVDYQRAGYTLTLIAVAWHACGLWLLLRTGLSALLRTAVYRLLRRPLPPPDTTPELRALALYYAAYTFLFLCWSLPIGFIGLGIEHYYGFSQQSVPSYLRDTTISLLLGCALIPVLWCAYRLYVYAPRRWWVWLWALMVVLLFGQMVLQPLIIAPAYNKFTPLPPGPLRDHVTALATRAGIRDATILIADTSRRSRHVNAYVTGWGPSTRIVIQDNALKLLPEDEILAMLGHEMGHYVEGHVWILFLGSTIGAGMLLWLTAYLLPRLVRRFGPRYRLRGVTDLAALPLASLILYVLLQAQLPLANIESRYLEHRADVYGLKLTHLNDATARLFVGFAERDFSDPNPPVLFQWWFGTHPPLASRIAFAHNYHDGER